MKRLLFEIHRWVGVVLALFMLLWFFSGLVIVFTGQLSLSRNAQLAHAESLSPETGWLSLGEAWDRSADARKAAARAESTGRGSEDHRNGERGSEERSKEGKAGNGRGKGAGGNTIVEARLLRQSDKPVWLVEDGRNRRFAISALDGKLHEVTEDEALEIATRWLAHENKSNVELKYLDTIDSSSSLRNQQSLRPFHRIAVKDGAGTELLISARSGEVLQAASRLDRALYYAGNWLHLFRPLDAIGWGEARRDILTWLGFFAFAGALTGMIVGWLRWRPGWFGKHTYSEGRTQPYRAFWFKWHFWSGLLGGTLAVLWAFSGYLDNNPFKLFSEGNTSREELSKFIGPDVPPAMRHWKPAPLADESADVVELKWRRLGDQSVLIASTRDGQRLPQETEGSVKKFDNATLQTAVNRLANGAPISRTVVLNEYDDYYYLRHHRDAAEKPLPVVRVELGDAVATHYYIDPQDGRLLLKRDRSSRAMRWLYSAIHHWDFGWLYKRPFWDIWMVIWVSFGLVLSLTAVVVGWKRLLLTFRPAKRKVPRKAESIPALATENQAN